jgi:hypothetical protein
VSVDQDVGATPPSPFTPASSDGTDIEMLTTAEDVPPAPSVIEYEKLSAPVNPVAGRYVMRSRWPAARSTLTVPCPACDVPAIVPAEGTSRSLASTSIVSSTSARGTTIVSVTAEIAMSLRASSGSSPAADT